MVTATTWATGQVFWSMVWFTVLMIWVVLVVKVFGDLFRSNMSGWAKALWTLFVIVAPFLGVLVYLIARGREMNEYAMAGGYEREARMSNRVRQDSW